MTNTDKYITSRVIKNMPGTFCWFPWVLHDTLLRTPFPPKIWSLWKRRTAVLPLDVQTNSGKMPQYLWGEPTPTVSTCRKIEFRKQPLLKLTWMSLFRANIDVSSRKNTLCNRKPSLAEQARTQGGGGGWGSNPPLNPKPPPPLWLCIFFFFLLVTPEVGSSRTDGTPTQ